MLLGLDLLLVLLALLLCYAIWRMRKEKLGFGPFFVLRDDLRLMPERFQRRNINLDHTVDRQFDGDQPRPR